MARQNNRGEGFFQFVRIWEKFPIFCLCFFTLGCIMIISRELSVILCGQNINADDDKEIKSEAETIERSMNMMNVGAVSSQRSLFWDYTHLSSGKRINTAKDDAAGLAIAMKMQREETGLRAGAENAGMAIGAANVAEGALGEMSDYLQRIHDLALRSMNGINSAEDKQVYQDEINQLKQGIESLAKNTTFNEQTLLDGSMADLSTAVSPSGGHMSIQMKNSTLAALGIEDLDVTSKDFNLDSIKKAMGMVMERRSSLGASTNALEHVRNFNNAASIEQLSSRSRLEDLDFPKAISKKKQDEVMGQYRMHMIRRQMEQKKSVMGLF